MTTKQLEKALIEFNKGKRLISATSVRMWLGIGQNKATDLLTGLETFDNKFFVLDVAERIAERSVVKWR
jgi:hypothetical protein